MVKISCFSAIGKFIKFTDKFFQGVCAVVRTLGLQPLFTVAVVWLALKTFLPPEQFTRALLIVMIVITVLAALYAVIATVYHVVDCAKNAERKKEKKKKRKGSDIDKKGETEKPKYYRVKQNPNYVMAEYSDRYELYYDDGNELKFVKVNFKDKENGNKND